MAVMVRVVLRLQAATTGLNKAIRSCSARPAAHTQLANFHVVCTAGYSTMMTGAEHLSRVTLPIALHIIVCTVVDMRSHTYLVPDVIYAHVVAVEVPVLSCVEAQPLACRLAELRSS